MVVWLVDPTDERLLRYCAYRSTLAMPWGVSDDANGLALSTVQQIGA